MKAEFYKSRWNELKGKTDKDQLSRLSSRIALSFLDYYFYNDRYDQAYIRLLCDMATKFKDESLNKIASSALFGTVIEGLCDDFEELQTETYNRVMSEVVSYCRKTKEGKEFDRTLNDFELTSFDDVYRRAEKLRNEAAKGRKILKDPEKILVLSRVTIGADVTITSVIIQRLINHFPAAEIVLIGDKKLSEIFSGNSNIRLARAEYVRRGGLVERFNSWHSVLDIIRNETEDDESGKFLLVDPDSRFSQLGVLPLVEDEKYLFFNSRGSDLYPKKISLAELANQWMDRILGESEFSYPSVWIDESFLDAAAGFAKDLRKKGCRKIIAVNFGVGGNHRKRLEGDFEEKLLLALLKEPRTVVLLDKGFGDEETMRTDALLGAVRNHGHEVKDTAFNYLHGNCIKDGIIGIQSGIGEVSALIAQCDEFIGYDSACQHIAAALGIPAYTVFAGSNNPRFIRRWSPCGPSKSEIIHVDTLSHSQPFENDDIIARLIDERD